LERSGKLVYLWLRNNQISIRPEHVRRIPVHPDSVSRDEFEAKLLSMNMDVSADFPWKRSECLFLFPKLFFKLGPQLRPVVSLLNRDQLRFFLTGDAKNDSIFKRQGYTEENGDEVHVTSHAFRRWLATLAINRGMSAEQVRNWLGQESERAQGAYDCRTPHDMAEQARRAIGTGSGIGPMADIARSKEPGDGILKIGRKLGIGTSVVQRVFKQVPGLS
jgi:integrase